jgi:hypothetical protein
VPFTPETGGQWTNKRWPDQTAPLDEVTWVAADGLRYLRPEVALMMKAGIAREKDQLDAIVTIPLLDHGQRRWLRDILETTTPHHPWLDQL